MHSPPPPITLGAIASYSAIASAVWRFPWDNDAPAQIPRYSPPVGPFRQTAARTVQHTVRRKIGRHTTPLECSGCAGVRCPSALATAWPVIAASLELRYLKC
jgi:hypothetical protein